MRRHLLALPLYDVDTLFITDEPTHDIPLAEELSVNLISDQALQALMAEAEHTVVFS